MLEGGATHLGVATDHVIESFRNDLWDDLQDRRGDRSAAQVAVPAAGGGARGARCRGVGDDRVRSRRRARIGRVRRARPTTVSSGSSSARPTRISVSAWAARSCSSTAATTSISTPRPCATSSAFRPSRFPTGSRSSATAPTAFPGLPGFGAKTAAALLARYGHIEAIPDDPKSWDVPGVRGADRLGATLAAGRGGRRPVQGPRDPAHRRQGRRGRRLGVARPDRRPSQIGPSGSDRRDSRPAPTRWRAREEHRERKGCGRWSSPQARASRRSP